jgi:hypothetical protein
VNDFIRLFEKSVIISGMLALMLVATGCYLWATGKNVPQELYLLLGTIVGFFFGAKQYSTTAGGSGR